MKHISLFSGIGGFDLAAEWMGWENAAHCEWNEFGRKVLKHYWPKAKSHEDITKTDFNIYRGRVDIVTGGFPCQPYSTAGKRLGKEDDRHLWPEMLRAIREIKPTWVVAENVSGLVNWNEGLVFDEVQTDLEAEGYKVQPVLLPACGVNAPHKRERVWFIAYSSGARTEGLQRKGSDRIHGFKTTSHASSNGLERAEESEEKHNRGVQEGLEKGYEPNALHGHGNVTNANSQGLPKRIQSKLGQSKDQARTFKGRKSTRNNSKGNWEKFPTQSPVCTGNDGISDRLDGITFPKWRNESIKATGNAIVPQVAHQIFKVIKQIEDDRRI